MGKYVEVNRNKMIHFLEACGFGRRVVGNELVFVRAHHVCGDVWVKVWTTLPSTEGKNTRGKGLDAIRVTAAYESEDRIYQGKKNFGLLKTSRVFRTGTEQAVLDRLYERMREAYARTNAWVTAHSAGLSRRTTEGAGPPPVKPAPTPRAGMILSDWKQAADRAAQKYQGRLNWSKISDLARVAFNERRSPVDFAEQYAIGAKHPKGIWEDES